VAFPATVHAAEVVSVSRRWLRSTSLGREAALPGASLASGRRPEATSAHDGQDLYLLLRVVGAEQALEQFGVLGVFDICLAGL
jgi:hypothetical protein